MTKIHIPRPAALLTVAALWLMSASCKGRTAENMEPTGDTVEVTIGNCVTPAEALATDSTTSDSSQTQDRHEN